MSNTAPPNDGDLKRLGDWDARWAENKIGFHKAGVNDNLVNHLHELQEGLQVKDAGKPRVFVPLCGKSVDLPYLARNGFSVVGLEWSAKACADFFSENHLDHEIEPAKDSKTPATEEYKPMIHRTSQADIEIIQDDLFSARLPQVDCIYDRASMIAVLPAVRRQYADTLLGCLKPGGRILCITLTREVAPDVGPPFSVLHEDFLKIYEEERGCKVQLLETRPVAESTQGGVERIYLVKKP